MGRRWIVTLAAALVAAACTSAAPPPPPSAPASASRAGTAPPTQPADRGDLGSRLRPLANGWIPKLPNLVVATATPGDRTALTAIEPATGAVTLLATFFRDTGWHLSRNGDALVVALETSATTSRIAYWEPSTSSTGWLTPDEERVVVHTPVFSVEGVYIYHAAALATPSGFTDLGIFKMFADGSDLTRIRPPDGNGGQLQDVTPDGGGLVWSRIRAGGSADILDLSTGMDREFDRNSAASVVAVRRKDPRALVIAGGGAGRPGGALYLWDDRAGASRPLLGTAGTGATAVGSADWEPGGERIAAVVYDGSVDASHASLAVIDPNTGARSPLAGTDGAIAVRWLPGALVFTRDSGEGTDVLLWTSATVPPKLLFHATNRVRSVQAIVP